MSKEFKRLYRWAIEGSRIAYIPSENSIVVFSKIGPPAICYRVFVYDQHITGKFGKCPKLES